MLRTYLKRVIRIGFINFVRNGYVSLASVLIMTVALSVVSSLVFTKAVLDSTLNQIKEKVDINVYFTTSAPEDDILTLKKRIEGMPEVDKVFYSSREEELERFKERHQNDELTLQALEEIGQNPLGASLNIKAKDPSQYEGIAGFLENQKKESQASIIDKVNYNKNKEAISALNKIIGASKKLGIAAVLFFALVALLITFNTTRLTIYMYREEISVMRLVGASASYIKGPFVVTGLLYGLIGTILTMLLLLPISYWAGPYTEALGTGLSTWSYYLGSILKFFAILIISGFGIGALSSYLAVKKYLKV